jgi:hypothetical protein
MAVMKAHLLQKIDKELNCDCLKPADVSASDFPGGRELERSPAVSDDNADPPRCGGVNKQMKVL